MIFARVIWPCGKVVERSQRRNVRTLTASMEKS
jgi:hypothetical protein